MDKPFEQITPDELIDLSGDYHECTVIVRGNVLNAVTALEMSIDLYITEYFTNDSVKGEELMNLIISPRMSFENKVQVMLVLMERYRPDILEENKTIRTDLVDQIIGERNVLAHYPLDTTPSGVKTFYETNNLTFFKFKNIKESDGKGAKKEIKLSNKIIYNVKKSSELLELINKYHLLITINITTAQPPTP